MEKFPSLVTCGFTTYNSEKTIVRALRSALEQDYINIELLIVDDCSSDETLKVINEFLCKKEVDYKLIQHNLNLGVAEARNTLIDNARGEFIVFFDSDDVSKKNRISKQVSKIKEYENKSLKVNQLIYSPLCYSDREIIFPKKNKIYCLGMSISQKDILNKEKIIGALLFCYPFPESSLAGSTATCMLCSRVETIKKINGFNSKLRRFEDLDLAIRAIMKDISICKVNQSLVEQFYTNYDYKIHENRYAMRLIYQHRKWLKNRNLFKFAVYYIVFKKSILNFNIKKIIYSFYALCIDNPILLIRKLISSLNTFLFTIKITLLKNQYKK